MNGKPSKSGRASQFRNWVSLSGVVIATGSFFAFLLLFAIDIFSHHGNPYMGLLAYLVAPAFTTLGVALILIGARMHKKKEKLAEAGVPLTFMIDLKRPRDRKALVGFIAGTLVFLLATAMGSYNTYHFTESIQFCGQACHGPMKPEFTAYLGGSHARVACTDCHVGPGATWYVKSKINGVHQLYCTLSGDIHRPIPTPIKNLRPAQETCEQCHWPQKFVGNMDKTYAHYLADETNTPFTVRLLLKVGGGDMAHGPANGIHWHMNVANKIEYITSDDQRQTIPWVRVTSSNGVATVYKTSKFTNDPSAYEVRKMDCMDCHNRPAHDFRPPDDTVDLAMSLGRIDSSLHWVKSNAMSVLVQKYSTEDEALQKISTTLRGDYPNYGNIDSLVDEVQDIYKHSFFPEMKADWRAYPNNVGHKNWAGCFRCHDGLHRTEDKKTQIPATDCNTCHIILAQGSGEELNKLNAKGHAFFHLDGEMSDFSCNGCHTGGFVQ